MKLPWVVQKVGIGVVTRGWSLVTSLLMAIIAARLLGQADFGIYAIASAFVVLLQALMYGGIYDFIIKDRSQEFSLSTCFWMNLVFGALGMVVVGMLSIVMGFLTHSAQVTDLMLWLAPSAIIASVSSWQEAVMLRQGRLVEYYIQCIVVETTAATVGLLLLTHGFGLYSLVAYRYSQLAMSSLCYAFLLRQRPAFEWHRDTVRAAWGFSINIYGSRIVGILASYSGDILIGTLISPAAAGAYRLASRIVLAVSELFYQPVATIAWVHFARTEGEPSALRSEWLALATLLSLTAWPALAGLGLVGKDVLLQIVGPGWSDAAVVIEILAVSRILAAFEVFLDPTLGILNRSVLILKVRTIGAVCAVALLVATSRYGAPGAAVAQVIVSSGMAIVAVRFALRATRMPWRGLLTALAPGIACTVTTLIAASGVSMMLSAHAMPPLPALALTVTGGIIAYCCTLAIVYREARWSGRAILPSTERAGHAMAYPQDP